MSATRTITIQEVRRNLPQFFRDLAAGRTYTVISHSKPLVTVSREKTAGQPEGIKTAMEQMLAVAAKSREASARSGHALPADKSYKELYLEDMAENMILIDANVALEVLLDNRRSQAAVIEYLTAQNQVSLTMLSVHLVVHFCRRQKVPDAIIWAFLDHAKLVAIVPADYTWALQNEQGHDFEDALQVAAALRSEADTFVTLDQRLVDAYKSKVGLNFINPAVTTLSST